MRTSNLNTKDKVVLFVFFFFEEFNLYYNCWDIPIDPHTPTYLRTGLTDDRWMTPTDAQLYRPH